MTSFIIFGLCYSSNEKLTTCVMFLFPPSKILSPFDRLIKNKKNLVMFSCAHNLSMSYVNSRYRAAFYRLLLLRITTKYDISHLQKYFF